MRIDAMDLFHISMPLLGDFRISRGVISERHMLLVRVHADGAYGWGEAGADLVPLYSYETVGTCRHIVGDLLARDLFETDLPEDGAGAAAAARFARWPWHPMAKAVLEEAIWDLEARRKGIPVHELYGGDRPVRDRIMVGISLGIQDDYEVLAGQISAAIDNGYRRIKLKIEPGHDVAVVAETRKRFGEVPLMVDANCGYATDEQGMAPLLALDEFALEMIEQPFEVEELDAHARLQARLQTPLCLDESAKSPEITREALDRDAARIINIKCSRLGGRNAGIAVHDLCAERGVPVWCGGMLEAGIGRLHNLAIAALPNFCMANDLSASARYWTEDIIEPQVELDADGTVLLSREPGIGAQVVQERIDRHLVWSDTLRP